MSSYLPNSYSSFRSGTGTSCGNGMLTSNNFTYIRQIDNYHSLTDEDSEGIYPRFPPYNRVDVRPISSHCNNSFLRNNVSTSTKTNTLQENSDKTKINRNYTKLPTIKKDPNQLSDKPAQRETTPNSTKFCHSPKDFSPKKNPPSVDAKSSSDEENPESDNTSDKPIYPWMKSQYGGFSLQPLMLDFLSQAISSFYVLSLRFSILHFGTQAHLKRGILPQSKAFVSGNAILQQKMKKLKIHKI